MVSKEIGKKILAGGVIGGVILYLSKSGLLNAESGTGSFGSSGSGDSSTNFGEEGISGETESGLTYNINIPATPSDTNFWGDGETSSSSDEPVTITKVLTDNSVNQTKKSAIASVNDVAGANAWIEQNVGSSNVKQLSEVIDTSKNETSVVQGDGTFGASAIGNWSEQLKVLNSGNLTTDKKSSSGTGTATIKPITSVIDTSNLAKTVASGNETYGVGTCGNISSQASNLNKINSGNVSSGSSTKTSTTSTVTTKKKVSLAQAKGSVSRR